MAVDDCHREKGSSTARSKQGCAWPWLIDAAVRLARAIKKDTDRPALIKPLLYGLLLDHLLPVSPGKRRRRG